MKNKGFVFVALAAALMLGSCSDVKKDDVKRENVAQTAETDTDSVSESLPENVFMEVPEEAVDDFDYISKNTGDIFPEAKGKKMYGYKGEQQIESDGKKVDLYVFDFYTYKKKTDEYTKISTIAKDKNSDTIYVYNVLSEKFKPAAPAEKEQQWADNATAALVNRQTNEQADINDIGEDILK